MPSPQKEAAERFQAEQDAAAAALDEATIARLEEELDAAPIETATDEGFKPITSSAPPPLVPPTAAVIAAEAESIAEPAEATPNRDDEPAAAPDDNEPRRRELSGKYVVLVLDTKGAGWLLLTDVAGEPRLYDGPGDRAKRSALEDDAAEDLADAVRADFERYRFAAIPASSWAPTAMKPRVMKTTWTAVSP